MKKVFAANWKLHKNPQETRTFFHAWKEQAGLLKSDVWFFPPAINLQATAEALTGTLVKFGLQNVCAELKGAFTGENSAQVLREMQGHGVLIGHSERRSLFAETSSLLAKKVKTVQDLGLTAMFCIGETLAERQAGQTSNVIAEQLRSGLELADRSKSLIIAYEPVWAIGTGVVATPEQVREAHAWVYEQLQKLGFSSQTPLLYGGSVKPENAKELIAISHVDGFLVGGASLEVETFLKICRCVE